MCDDRPDATNPTADHALLTTSWDDGHPLDLRLADLLEASGVPGTFYIPREDKLDGRPVVTEDQIRGLADRGFEIGAHTLDHTPLTTVDDDEARRQIVESKRWVEEVTGRPCRLFCPPRGWFNDAHVAMIAEAGFEGFRTVELWSKDLPRPTGCGQLGEMPTSLHARDYAVSGMIRNVLKRRALGNAWRLLKHGLNGHWSDHAMRMFDEAVAHRGCFHLWGHSWEFETPRDWSCLQRVLDQLGGRINKPAGPARATTNAGVFDNFETDPPGA